MARKKKEKPKTVKEIMAEIIDYSSLEEKKKQASEKSDKPRKIKPKPKADEKPLRWFEKPITPDMFLIKKYDGKYYAKHNEWNKRVWIGPYAKKSDVDAIIKSYMENSLLTPLKRKDIKDLHSILIDIE